MRSLLAAALVVQAALCTAFAPTSLVGLTAPSLSSRSLSAFSARPIANKQHVGASLSMASEQLQVSRREALFSTLGFAAAALLNPQPAHAADVYKLPKLPYAYDALEPYIDKATMEFHHDKHFNAYMTNLNKALEGKPKPNTLVDVQKTAIKDGVAFRNNGGGFYNHGMFFQNLAPASESGKPSDALAKAIDASFGSFDEMKKQFSAAAAARFGSGWAWLGVAPDGKLVVGTTPNQDNPLMEGVEGPKMIPILGLDVWEHAYYLKYQNRRPEYIANFWNVVNWKIVSDNYESYAAKGEDVCWCKRKS